MFYAGKIAFEIKTNIITTKPTNPFLASISSSDRIYFITHDWSRESLPRI